MRRHRWKLGMGLLLVGVLTGWGFAAQHQKQEQAPELKPIPERVFFYTATKLGLPILKASIKIANGSTSEGKPLYEIRASIESPSFNFLFRMKNRFLSIMDAETCTPIRYVKTIDQEGLLIGRKNYVQTFTFDYPHKKVVAEKGENKERQEFPLLQTTYDPLSMFAKYYLKEEIRPWQEIPMSIFDGFRSRRMIFYSKKRKIKSKRYGEVEAVCLESSTSFSTFDDREGKIRIWYTADNERIPILIELDLPVGHITFELDSMEKS